MRRLSLALAITTLTAGAVPATADPTGEWRVEDGIAHIRTVLCAERLWGVVSWESTRGHTDAKNPDPSLRNRPTLGIPIILGMKPVKPNQWEGSIYNARDGKTYQGTVTLKEPDIMEVEGCVLGGWLCSGQDWTRVKPATTASIGAAPPADLCVRLGMAPQRPGAGGGRK